MDSQWLLLFVSIIVEIVFTSSSPLDFNEVPKRIKRGFDFYPYPTSDRNDKWPFDKRTPSPVVDTYRTWSILWVVIPMLTIGITIAIIVTIVVWCRRKNALLHAPGMIVIGHNQPTSLVPPPQTLTSSALPPSYPGPNPSYVTSPNYNPYYPVQEQQQIVNPIPSSAPSYTEHPSENQLPNHYQTKY